MPRAQALALQLLATAAVALAIAAAASPQQAVRLQDNANAPTHATDATPSTLHRTPPRSSCSSTASLAGASMS